jgi:hypothetical protein
VFGFTCSYQAEIIATEEQQEPINEDCWWAPINEIAADNPFMLTAGSG